MKTNRMILLGLTALALLCGKEAQAFYNPTTGRWLSRDPIHEIGGLNLNALLVNDPANNVDYLGQWNQNLHQEKTTFWAGLFFRSSYSTKIGTADQGVDDSPFTSSVGPGKDRHMACIKGGMDSRDWWYMTKFASAVHFLERADKDQKAHFCAKAAKAFGQGLHSRQDKSAHRQHPIQTTDWPGGRNHPGWWDAWDNSEYTAYGWSDVYWRRDVNMPPLYYPWARGANEAHIQVQQRKLQEDARGAVISDSFSALGEFESAVMNSCLCRDEMLLDP